MGLAAVAYGAPLVDHMQSGVSWIYAYASGAYKPAANQLDNNTSTYYENYPCASGDWTAVVFPVAVTFETVYLLRYSHNLVTADIYAGNSANPSQNVRCAAVTAMEGAYRCSATATYIHIWGVDDPSCSYMKIAEWRVFSDIEVG